MSFSSEIKANIIKNAGGLDMKALVCVFKYFSNNNRIVTANSKVARFILKNIPGAHSRIKEGVKRKSHLYEIVFDNFLCGEFGDRETVIGAFLLCGSISSPKKSYNLEFVLVDEAKANVLLDTLTALDLNFHKIKRKNRYVLYTKSSETIIYFLYYIGDNIRAGEIENMAILRGIKSRVKRTMNFEIHNEELRLNAANKQINMINAISNKIGLSNIDQALVEIAVLRLDNPEKSLSELGKLCEPILTKSGVNSRLKRIEKLYTSLEE